MTTLTAPTMLTSPTPLSAPTMLTSLTFAAQDSITMLGRELKHTFRFPLMLIGTVVMPAVLLLLFVYILGGPIGAGLGDSARGASYVDFLVPGIIIMTVAASTGPTAISVCIDMTGGIVDRFRTMPVTRGALLAGHVGGNVLRTLAATCVITGVALLVGFRPQASVSDWLAAAGIVAAFSFALAWLSAALGLVTKSIAGANSATLPIQLLLPFLSSTFVPADSMPAGVRWFTANQPFTPLVECLRALLTGAPASNTAYLALAWCAAIALAGYLWALAAFRRRTR
jgi:ABC-2 type transport system permease protein